MYFHESIKYIYLGTSNIFKRGRIYCFNGIIKSIDGLYYYMFIDKYENTYIINVKHKLTGMIPLYIFN